MKNIFSLVMFLSFSIGFGQEPVVSKKENKVESKNDYSPIYTTVEEQAIPPGGLNAFRKHFGMSFKMPKIDVTTTATITARFVVWDDGSIRDVQIIKETPENLGFGKEAIRVLSNSEKWEPGKMNGKPVKQYYTLPFQIQISGSDD